MSTPQVTTIGGSPQAAPSASFGLGLALPLVGDLLGYDVEERVRTPTGLGVDVGGVDLDAPGAAGEPPVSRTPART